MGEIDSGTSALDYYTTRVATLLDELRSKKYEDTTKWVLFKNMELGKTNKVEFMCLAIGPGRTYEEIPDTLPDSHLGAGWSYKPVGYINLETGRVDPIDRG